MNINDYQFMQGLNMTQLTPEQLEELSHKLPSYTIYNSYSMLTWLIIHITLLSTLIVFIGIVTFLYCKFWDMSNQSKTSSLFWLRKNKQKAETMLCHMRHGIKAPPSSNPKGHQTLVNL